MIAECLSSLLTVAPRSSLPFVAELLDADERALSEMAALALGSARLPEALPVLRAWHARNRDDELRSISDAARLGAKLGLEVGVGHGIGYRNAPPLAALGEVEEFSIGHSIVSRALLVGMERAVREMRELVVRA